jgi:glutaredoxin
MFFVYGKESCPYCHEATRLLKKHGYEVVYLDVGERPEWRDPEWKTVPQVFHGGIYIGGFGDLERYLETL